MDIMLERILSLIPKTETGKFVHGALKTFANEIGLKSGNLISDWIAGRSSSYKSYIYEISQKYNVSVEWLRGETDIKEKTASPTADGLSEYDIKALAWFHSLSPEKRKAILSLADGPEELAELPDCE